MSTKRKKTTSSGSSEIPAASLPAISAASQFPETAANVRDTEISGLSHRQKSVLPILAVSHTLAQAARDSGVSERTLRKWLDDPSFRADLDRLREESYELARQQFQVLVPMFLSVLAKEAVENPDPAIRIRAARYGMNYAARFRDHDKVVEDVQDLRAALLDRN